MKKIIILTLALAGAAGSALSQQNVTIYPNGNISLTDHMFNKPVPGSSRIRFDFNFTSGNRASLELAKLNQIDSLPDLDSLMGLITKSLVLLSDSLNDELSNQRIDFIAGNINKVRIVRYPQKDGIFQLNNGSVTQLKVEQDTLRITLYTREPMLQNKKTISFYRAYFLNFYVNNIKELSSLPLDKLKSAIEAVSREVEKHKKTDSEFRTGKYFANYNVLTGKKTYSNIRANKGFRFTSDPYVQSSFQYMRGVFVPSAAVGLKLTQTKGSAQDFLREWRLMWEPLFYFSRDLNNKLHTDRNDFITFKQYSRSSFISSEKKIEFVQNLSFGYLIRRKGNWLEKHTVKFSLPTGIQYKNILLEPEFVFNDLFQNFSPSIRFTVIFE